jgi:hypothetical protein
MFGIDGNEKYSIQKNIFFPIAMSDKAWFLQTLAFASLHRDRMYGLQQESIRSIRYLTAAVRAFNDSLSFPDSQDSIKVLGAISSAAYIEYAMGRSSSFEIHLRALLHLLRKQSSRKGAWEDGVSAVLLSHLLSFCKAHVEMTCRISDRDNQLPSEDAQELYEAAGRCLGLFERFAVWRAELQNRVFLQDHGSDIERLVRHQQKLVFGASSVVMRLLRGSERLRSPTQKVAENEEAYHLYGLCYLVLALWEYRHTPLRCHDFLSQFLSEFLEHRSTQYSVAGLVWLLLKRVECTRPYRRWKALDMTRTLYLLGETTRDAVARSLLTILEQVGREI